MSPAARRIVVDSDVLIAVLRGDAALGAALSRLVASGIPVAVTPIAVAEVMAGMRPSEAPRTRNLLAAFDCLRIDRAVGELAGRFIGRFGRSHAVELPDALLAACAVVNRHRLWTLNRKHYPMRELRFVSSRIR
jgi:predicted nucleic acid-binding protein